MDDIKIVTPSHKRAKAITTVKVIKKVIICVPENQKSEYEEYSAGFEVIGHPDDIIGLSPKRQWIYKKFGDVFMVDDDVKYIERVYLGEQNAHYPKKLTSDEAYNLIQDTYRICKDAGIKLFTFSNRGNPVAFSGLRPYRLNGYVNGGSFGILQDDNLYFPNVPDFVGEDYFISGLNAYYNRYCWMDERFVFSYNQTEMRVGGCADYRTEEKREKTFFC